METNSIAGIQAFLKFGLRTEKQLEMNWDSKPCSCDQFRHAGTQQEASVTFESNLRRDAATADFIFPILKETYPAGATSCWKAEWDGTAAIHPLCELWVKVSCLWTNTQVSPKAPKPSDKQKSLNQLRII